MKPVGRRAKVFLLWGLDEDSERADKRRQVRATDFVAEDMSLKMTMPMARQYKHERQRVDP